MFLQNLIPAQKYTKLTNLNINGTITGNNEGNIIIT